jgi:hypothetical protein
MMSRLARTFLVIVLCGLVALVPRSQTHALTLVPPPPPGATCQTTGTGISCHGDVTSSGVNFDTGISCGTFEILYTFTQTITYELHYNSAGLGIEAAFHWNVPGTFINSVTGKTITSNAHYTAILTGVTPGDPSTAIVTLNGALGISTGQHFGLVAHDVGTITFDPSGNILFEGGPHNSIDNFPAFVQAVCAALS